MSGDTLYIKRLRPVVKTITVSKTRPNDTVAYADNDTVSESTSAGTVWTFANVARTVGGGALLHTAQLISSIAQSIKIDAELWLFDTTVTGGLNDNAAFAPTDAEMKTRVAFLQFFNGLWITGNGNGGMVLPGLGQLIQCAAASKDLYGVLRQRGAYAPGALEEFTLRLSFIQY
jgi:hypothetical protein